MKKLLSLLLALAMMLGCVAFAESVDYTGTWVLTGVEIPGVSMGPSMLAMSGMEITMTLNADGTAVLTAAGEEEVGNWTATETGVSLTDASGVTDALVYQDEMLVMEQDGARMMFTREGAAPAIVEDAEPVAQANVDPASFEGQWLLSKVSMMGMNFSAEDLGMYMAFVLSEGKGIMGTNESEDGSIVTAEVVYAVAEAEGIGTALTIVPVLEEGAEDEEPLVLFMSQNGELFVSQDGASMIFVKQVEAPAAE